MTRVARALAVSCLLGFEFAPSLCEEPGWRSQFLSTAGDILDEEHPATTQTAESETAAGSSEEIPPTAGDILDEEVPAATVTKRTAAVADPSQVQSAIKKAREVLREKNPGQMRPDQVQKILDDWEALSLEEQEMADASQKQMVEGARQKQEQVKKAELRKAQRQADKKAAKEAESLDPLAAEGKGRGEKEAEISERRAARQAEKQRKKSVYDALPKEEKDQRDRLQQEERAIKEDVRLKRKLNKLLTDSVKHNAPEVAEELILAGADRNVVPKVLVESASHPMMARLFEL